MTLFLPKVMPLPLLQFLFFLFFPLTHYHPTSWNSVFSGFSDTSLVPLRFISYPSNNNCKLLGTLFFFFCFSACNCDIPSCMTSALDSAVISSTDLFHLLAFSHHFCADGSKITLFRGLSLGFTLICLQGLRGTST